MTLVELVNKLTIEGNNIKYRVRPDGGIIVTEINGVKYSGASGNAIVRTMTGAKLSEARRVQLQRIKPPKKVAPQKRRKPELDTEIKKELRRVQRKIRQRRKETGKFTGTVTTSNIRWTLEHEGKRAALEKLRQANRYASGLAYDANIDALIGYIAEVAAKFQGSPSDYTAFLELIEKINRARDRIREEDILPTYQILYQLNNGVLPRDVINQVIAQLKL